MADFGQYRTVMLASTYFIDQAGRLHETTDVPHKKGTPVVELNVGENGIVANYKVLTEDNDAYTILKDYNDKRRPVR